MHATTTACLKGRAPSYAIDLRLRCKNDSWKWILIRGMVVSRDARGLPLRMIGIHTGISERKRTETELRELNAQFSEKTRLLQSTLSTQVRHFLSASA